MKSFLKKLFALLIIAILALTISIVSYYFLIGQEPKKEKIKVAIKATVFKEDGFGGWTPITNSDEIIDGHLNFECNITNYDYIKGKSLNITFVEFYLSNTVPNIQNPNLDEYSLIRTFNDDKNQYSYMLDSRSLPDDTWYFITRVIDSQNKSTYDTYNINDVLIPFTIEHFDDSITFNYLDINGRINYNSHIGFVPLWGFEKYIESVDLFIVYNGTPERLTGTPINYFEIKSNYNLLSLEMLSSWIENNSIPPDEYNISFIITLHLDYGNSFQKYSNNYSLNMITLDIIGPNITISENIFGNTYSNVEQSILIIPIDIHDDDFESVKFEYMYSTHEPSKEIWYYYNTFIGTSIIFNIINWRDDKIFLRFTAYDDLGNVKLYQNDSYWIRKNMNNHPNFGLEGIGNNYFYTISDGMIDLRVAVYPYDNDITSALVYTDYESFEINNIIVIGDHIKITEDGNDIKLDPVYYNIYGSLFTVIPINVVLFQGNNYITSKAFSILATYLTFQDKVNISSIEIDPNITQSDNIWMIFTTGTDSYKNLNEIPYIANKNPPIVKIYNSQDTLMETIALNPVYDDTGFKNYTQGYIKIQNNFFNLSLAGLGEICTVDAIAIQGSYYDFNYFIQNSEIVYIKLLTGVNLDGIYGSTGAISMNYTISNMMHIDSQYKGRFNFQSLPPDNYSVMGEFYDISGRINSFTIHNMWWYLLDDIVIITPENKTYNAPMAGYYPATYGFDDEIVGTLGTSINFVDSVYYNYYDAFVSIAAEIGGHKNVLREDHPGFWDPNDHWDLFHNFDNSYITGYCEFWFRCGNPMTISQFLFMEGAIPGPHPQVKDGYFNYFDGTEHNLIPCNPDQWYHLAFEWYSNNTFDWYVDDTKILDGGSNLYNMLNGPDRIRLTAYGYTINYYDAFGFSWDPNYNIGDNKDEGLLISFEKVTGFGISLNWMGYSLDNQSVIIFLGNTTIPLPSEGLHSIQVFGEDIFGYIHYSEIRFFYIDT